MEEDQNKKTSFWAKSEIYLTPISIIIAGIIIAGAIIFVNFANKEKIVGKKDSTISQKNLDSNDYYQTKIDETNLQKISLEKEPSLGNSDASLTVIEFSDFECPFSARFHLETFPQIKKEYIDTGKIRLIFKNFPLSFHKFAQVAAQAGKCAQEQGKFWEYADSLFKNQENLEVENLKKYAQDLGLDIQEFNSCLDSEKYKEEITKDYEEGLNLGVIGTPYFIIGSEGLIGAESFSEFQKIIERNFK